MEKDELECIGMILSDDEIIDNGLHLEVIWSAIKHAQANPTATIAECMAAGYHKCIGDKK